MATKKKAAPKKAFKLIKKVAPAKKSLKNAPKKAVKPVHKSAKKPAAKATKPISKKTVKHAKPAPKKASKPIVKAVSKKPAALKTVKAKILKPSNKPMLKSKQEIKKPAVKPAAVKAPPARTAEPIKAKDIRIIPAKPVVLPKINTKTSRKYQPDFTKSVLDQPIHDLGASIVRYSDSDLAEFKDLIQRKLESAKKELSYLQGLITRKDEMGGDNDDARYMTMEDGSMSMEREQLSQMASRQITFIDHLEKALMRIENKTYGICRVTGRLIDKARLRAVPHATLSIEAKMGAVK